MKGFIGKAHKLFNADLAGPPRPPSAMTNPKVASMPKTSTSIAPSSTVGFSGMSSESDLKSTIEDPSALDILRYRYHHATNLGSVYVLERWLSPSRFPTGCKGTSELEAVKAWVAKTGVDETKKLFEAAWEGAVLDEYVIKEVVWAIAYGSAR